MTTAQSASNPAITLGPVESVRISARNRGEKRAILIDGKPVSKMTRNHPTLSWKVAESRANWRLGIDGFMATPKNTDAEIVAGLAAFIAEFSK